MKVTSECDPGKNGSDVTRADRSEPGLYRIVCFIIVVVCIFLNCYDGDEPLLVFESQEMTVLYGQPGTPEGYARVHVMYPYANGANHADSLNRIIATYIKQVLASYVREDVDADTFDNLGNAFIDEYRTFKASFPDAPYEWTLDITGEVCFHSSCLISLLFTTEAYPGGAHPLTTMHGINLLLPSCDDLALQDVTADTAMVCRLAEKQFRSKYGLSADADFADAGFWFPGNHFILSKTWYLTDEEIHFHYNPYEIAPYAHGTFDITLPLQLKTFPE